jgi:hypothetical protein
MAVGLPRVCETHKIHKNICLWKSTEVCGNPGGQRMPTWPRPCHVLTKSANRRVAPRPNSARAFMGFRGVFSQVSAPGGQGKHV